MRTQALGWLAAGVLAAGLNSSYHLGGMEWAHSIADRIGSSTGAVLALATGNADQFLAHAQVVKARREATACPFSAVLAQVESQIARPNGDFEGFEVMTDREQGQLAQLEANRARIEAQVARIRVASVPFRVVVPQPRVSICPRIRINIPRMPAVKMPPMPRISEGGTV